MSSPTRVLHVTTVHPADDPRVLHKECRTLRQAGFAVSLVAGAPNVEGQHGIRHVMLPPVAGRLQRVLVRPWHAMRAVLRERPDVCHFHDPELILLAVVLRVVHRIRVIYDVHEDVPQQILSKYWIQPSMRPAVAAVFRTFENSCVRLFDAVIAATPVIAQRFESLNSRTVSVSNFPSLAEFIVDRPWTNRPRAVAYIGAITFERGILELLSAITSIDVKLILAGPFASAEVEAAARAHPGWAKVEYLGWIDREGVRDVLARTRLGVVCLHPIVNYLESQPVKMFEYMAAGLPVVASNFPLWREFIEQTGAGVHVDPLNAQEIAAAIGMLLNDETRSTAMGEAGRKAVIERFSWEPQAKTLLSVYDQILDRAV